MTGLHRTAGPGTERMIHVIQGSQEVTADPHVVLTTILGSCVSTCMWDPVARVGGMNHFLLAHEPERGRSSDRYGTFAMELLINDLLKLGASRGRLKAKLFGGAMMDGHFGRIGRSNAAFATTFLAAEDIPVIAESLGGTQARRIRFVPVTGFAQQRLVPEHEAPPPTPTPVLPADDITFF